MKCPKCGYMGDQHTSLEEEKQSPKDGDISFCIECGEVSMIMKNKLVLVDERGLHPENILELARLRNAWANVKKVSR